MSPIFDICKQIVGNGNISVYNEDVHSKHIIVQM